MAAALWRSRPVFVSSTFADMHAERDYLRSHVFPELQQRLRERCHHLEPVDLRWGVQTITVDEQHVKETLVLKVCLEEINRCRPFLLVLLGDRYGWIPPGERMQAAVAEAGFQTETSGKSVTALEIEYGVLESTDQKRRSYFYLRDPLPYDEMPEELAALYSESHNPTSGAGAAAEQLTLLKTRIEADPSLQGRVHRYQAGWDAQQNRVIGLETWGRQVLEDLWRDLEEETRDFVRTAQADWRQHERWALEEFVEDCGRGFIGRVEISEELISLALSPAGELIRWGACVIGESGAGKSSLFAHLHRQLQRRSDVLLLAHAAGISPRSTQVDAMLRRWIAELSDHLDIENGLADDANAEEVEEAFRSLLYRASRNRRVIVLIDALNQFEPTPRARHLTWLPKLWPENARLIATAIPGTESDSADRRTGIELTALPVLSADEAEHIAEAVCQRYHRQLHPEVRRMLLKKQLPDGRPAAGIPLWLELALEELNLLDADDFERAHRDYAGTPEQRLHQMMLDVAAGLPGDVEGLYGQMLRRCEELHGRGWARAFAGLIAISRDGWRESDLRELLPRAAQMLAPDDPDEPWNELKFAALRRSFRAHVKQQGVTAQWDFFHAQMRRSVERALLSDAELVKRLHLFACNHLETLPTRDALRQTESMFHLMGSEDRQRAAQYYANLPRAGGACAAATAVLADQIIRGSDDARRTNLNRVLSLINLADLDPNVRAKVCRLFYVELVPALAHDTDLATRLNVLRMVVEVLEELWRKYPGSDTVLRELSVCYYRIGDLLKLQGNLAEALASCRTSLEIAENLAGSESADERRQLDLSVSHEKIGAILHVQGDLPAAIDAYRASLDICQQLVEQDPANYQWQHSLANAHQQIGDVLRAQGDLTAALSALGAAEAIRRRLASQYPASLFSQCNLAKTYNSIGEVQRARGDLRAALAAYQTGREILSRLSALDPSNTALQTDLSAVHSRVSDILSAQGDLHGALAASRAELSNAERLARRDPSNVLWQSNLSAGYDNVGDDLQSLGDLTGALAAHRASHAIDERLVQQDASNAEFQFKLSVSYGKIGAVLLEQDDFDGALEAYRAGLEIRRRLASQDPSNANWQRNLAVSHNNVGLALNAQEDWDGALAAFRAAGEIFDLLANQDPANASAQRDLAVNHIRIGEVLIAQADFPAALAAFRASLTICDGLATQDPSNTGWQMNLAGSNVRIGDVLFKLRDFDGALAAYRKALHICEILEQDSSSSGWKDNLFLCHLRIGDVYDRLGDAAGALAAYRKAVAVAARAASQGSGDERWRDNLSNARKNARRAYCSTWPAVFVGSGGSLLIALAAAYLPRLNAWYWLICGPLLALFIAVWFYQVRSINRRILAAARKFMKVGESTHR